MAELLTTLLDWPDVDSGPCRVISEWDEARRWGWIMESGELTGSGLAHARSLPTGILADDH